MRLHSAEALILRTYRYGEADRIVVFFTADRGKKRGVAKNATKSRRRFGAGLEPLTRGLVAYAEREHQELVHLDRIEPRQSPFAAASGRPLDEAAQVFAVASYFAELLDEWAQDGQANERLFRLGASVGDALALGGSTEALARYFEYWLLRLEGVYPSVNACGRCGAPTLHAGAVLATSEHRYCCGRCADGGVRLSSAAMSFLAAAGIRTPAAITAADVSTSALREVEQAHQRLMALHLEREPRSARVVKELRPHP